MRRVRKTPLHEQIVEEGLDEPQVTNFERDPEPEQEILPVQVVKVEDKELALKLALPMVKEFYDLIKPKRYSLLELEYRLAADVGLSTTGLFVVGDAKNVVGYSLNYLAQVIVPVIFICHLYIKPEFRGEIRYLRSLYEHMDAWSKVAGVRQILMAVQDKELAKMYKDMGFEIDSLLMWRELV